MTTGNNYSGRSAFHAVSFCAVVWVEIDSGINRKGFVQLKMVVDIRKV